MLQNALAQVAFGKQVAKGTPNAAPAYQHGVVGGPIVKVEASQSEDEQTSASRQQTSVYRDSVVPGVDFSVRAHKASIGAYLMAVYGAETVTGAADKTHVFSVGDTIPYHTFAAKRGGSELSKVTDVRIGELGLSWEGTKPLEAAVSGLGCDIVPTFTPWVAGLLDETNLETFFVPVGGTFKVKGSGAVPALAVVTGGSIKIANGIEALIASAALTPADLTIKRVAFECSLKLVVDDFTLWRQVLTGADAGTTITPVQYGSFELVFKENLNGTPAHQLKLEAARVAFKCDLPDVEPGGGPVELELSGIPVSTTADAAVKPTLVNAVAAY